MNIFVLDTETTKWNLIDDYIELRLVEILNCENDTYTECLNQQELNMFLGILLESETPSRIYTHNLDFDAKFIFPWLETIDSTVYNTFVCKTSRVLEIQVFYMKEGKKVKQLSFRDSFAILPDKLEKIGEKLGYPKGKYSENIDELKPYCKRDCEIVKRALQQYVSSVNELIFLENIKIKKYLEFSNLPLTTASVMKKLMRVINPKRWLNDFTYKSAEKLLRTFYFGGRTEVFDFNCLEDAYLYDFNSLYPSIFAEFEIPSLDFQILANENNYKLNECFSEKLVIATICTINENDYLPYFPTRIKGKTIFANGEKQVLMFGEEYNNIFKENKVNWKEISVEALIIGEQNDDLQNFYKRAYQIRQQSPFPLPMKWLLNGGYGKYAERRTKTERLYLPMNQENVKKILNEKGICKMQNDNFLLVEDKFDSSFLENNILVGAKISALSRMKLYLVLCDIDKRLNQYVDTDSDYTKNKIDDKFISNSELGKMKLEMIVHDFQAYSPKEYKYDSENKESHIFETHYKMKGMKTEGLDNEHEFDLISYYSSKGIDISRPAKISEIFRRNLDYNAVILGNKKKRTYYNKRIINDDLTTRPIDLNDNNDLIEFENKEKIMKILGVNE